MTERIAKVWTLKVLSLIYVLVAHVSKMFTVEKLLILLA